jgi:hypothetical protein
MVSFIPLADSQELDRIEEFENSEEDAHAPLQEPLKWYVLSESNELDKLNIVQAQTQLIDLN